MTPIKKAALVFAFFAITNYVGLIFFLGFWPATATAFLAICIAATLLLMLISTQVPSSTAAPDQEPTA